MSDLITMMSAAAGQVGGINPREYFNTTLYTGDGTTNRTITTGLQSDFVWIKRRNDTFGHILFDVIRGAGKTLRSQNTDAESNNGSFYVQQFNSDNFLLGNSDNASNASGGTYVSWVWKANGAGVSNTAGTIDSTVSVSTTSGFSIVTYTGNNTLAQSVGHGLGAAPAMIIVKSRSNVTNWLVWQKTYNVDSVLLLNGTDDLITGLTGLWGSANPTSTTFGLNRLDSDNNRSGQTYVAYCFAEVEGFSKFGSYTGNGSATGPSVTTDFEPTWLMIKRTNSTGDWIILDSARDTANPRDKFLEPNTIDAEATGNDVDFNATGFQLKSTSASINASGGTYIYACFA